MQHTHLACTISNILVPPGYKYATNACDHQFMIALGLCLCCFAGTVREKSCFSDLAQPRGDTQMMQDLAVKVMDLSRENSELNTEATGQQGGS
jgi:hypothetical protein